ncbi:MAG TPA: WYL domain-containing protein [Bryobacteraceae bacterium]|nr:WYL domain-containing protein [Bryobacteraceae bacterium]
MRADRLLSALLLLQANGRLTGRQLAERLEVSERTVHRDMEALAAAGVPILALRGAHGGWQLDEDWRTQVPGLDDAELRALLMAQPRALGDQRLAAAAERAIGKLMAALPAPLRERAANIRERLYVDTTGWWSRISDDLSRLPVVQDAVALDRKLFLRYRSPGREPVERTVDPLGLIAKDRTWYLYALTPRGFRTYRISRIEEARMLDEPSRRPADFDLAAAWKNSTQQFQEQRVPYAAVLSLEPSAAACLKRWCQATEVESPDGPVPEGWITLRVEFDHQREAHFMVLGFGARVLVREPEELRARVVENAAAILARNGRARPTDRLSATILPRAVSLPAASGSRPATAG